MKVTPIRPPRVFTVGRGRAIRIRDCARLDLEPDEQVTMATGSDAAYDIVRKSWGFYATPSLNSRLPRFGLRAVLIKSADGRFYIILVERDRMADFRRYCREEDLVVVAWLDTDQGLRALEGAIQHPNGAATGAPACYLCGGTALACTFRYSAPPEGETRFQSGASQPYRREVFRCDGCGHFVSVHDMDLTDLYAGEYVDSTYGEDGIRRAFERIISLDPEKSDNVGRVDRILEFWAARRNGSTVSDSPPTLLDVGSGLGVFLYKMKHAGWVCTALDPDARAVEHAREVVGVEAVCGDLATASDLGRFDVVTFNKVLEHVKDPVAMLAKAAECVKPGSFVYVEVPDGETAAVEGSGREEFFIDHWHAFSAASLALLAMRAAFSVRTIDRLREPSGKHTLRAFLVPAEGASPPGC